MKSEAKPLIDQTTLSSKGQLVIPKALRDQANWSVGDQLQVVYANDEIRLRRIEPLSKVTSLDAVAGRLHRPGQTSLSDEEIKSRTLARLRAKHTKG
jgi:AbrB family looped-hinge helix DNA binding protein